MHPRRQSIESLDEERSFSQLDRASAVANAFLFSRAYTVFVGVHVVLNLILFIWEMATVAGFKLPEHGLFVFLEIWVNLALILEILVRILVERKAYLKSKSNWFDVFVSVASIATLSFLFYGDTVWENMVEEASLVLMAFRYIIVLLRVAMLIKNQGKHLATEVTERVEIDTISNGVEFKHTTVDLSLEPISDHGHYADDSEGSSAESDHHEEL